MQDQNNLAEYFRNFRPFDAELGGLEEEYNLRGKFDDEDELDSVEPYLPFYVSITPKEPVSNSKPHVLHYGLTRTDYANGLRVSPEDYERLFNRVLRRVKYDVAAIHSGDRSSHLSRVRPKRLRR